MWLVAEKGSQSPINVTTMKLFDNQKDAEDYANNVEKYKVVCYIFEKPGQKYSKRIEYKTEEYKGNKLIKCNNANFSI